MSVALLLRLLGVALPLLVGLALRAYVRRRRTVALRLGDPALVASLVGEDLSRLPRRTVTLVALAALALGVAITDPRWGEAAEVRETRGGMVVLVLDASGSMLAEDLAPSRLERQREAARAVVRALPDAPVGVVVFAGRAYALVPPTADRAALELYLGAVGPAIVTQSGSSLSAAIRQGVGLLAASDDALAAGALVLVSDGDAQEDPARIREAVELARRAGVPIHALAAGTVAGAPVPDIDFATGERVGFKVDAEGDRAVSRLGEELLREIAAGSGGGYASLSDPGAVAGIVAELRESRGEAEAPGGGVPPRFAWFAAPALLLLLLESLAAAGPGGRRR